MGNEEELSVEGLCELWAQKQRTFEQDIRSLLDQSKELAEKMSVATEALADEPDDDEEALAKKMRSQQEFKLTELMIHLTEEMQRRHNEANAKKRMKEWHKSLDKMRIKILKISQTLQRIGLVDKVSIEKLCHTQEYTQSHYEMLGQELQRCETLRHKNLAILIDHVRSEINQWSELTLQFPTIRNYQNECYTEELLELLENKLGDLQNYYNSNKNIFAMYDKRVKMWRRMEALEEQAREPSRYNNRGGQLLREERERKHISTKLPQIEEQLSQLVQEYEQETGQSFLIYGDEIMSRLSSDWEEYRATKDLINNKRKTSKSTAMVDPIMAVSTSTFHSLFSIRETSSISQIVSSPNLTRACGKRLKKVSKWCINLSF